MRTIIPNSDEFKSYFSVENLYRVTNHHLMVAETANEELVCLIPIERISPDVFQELANLEYEYMSENTFTGGSDEEGGDSYEEFVQKVYEYLNSQDCLEFTNP